MSLVLIGLDTSSLAQSIKRISAPGKFYVNDKSSVGVVYNYAVYSISNNTGVSIPSMYVTLTNINSTNRIQLAPIDNGIRTLGSLAPGATKLAAFYLKGPSFTGNSDTLLNVTNETHTIQVLNGPPGVGSVVTSSNYSFTNIIYVIEAAANKITIITNLNPLAILGSDVALVIAGETGTIGGNNSVSFSPGVFGSWRPDAYQLVNTVVRFSQNPTYTNQLYFDPGISGFTNYSGQAYTNTFLFRAVKVTGTNLPISPFAFIDSGSGTKHTALDTLIAGGGSNIIYSASNTVSIVSHTVTPTSLLAPGGLITYSVTFSNHFIVPLNLDEILNVLPGSPANMTYVPGSATYNSVSITNPSISGQTLRWAQPFALPAGGTGTLTFQAIAPLPAGQYTNRVTGVIGSEQIDLTLDTTDNVPATSVFTLIPVSDLGLSKSAPATTPAAGNFNYTLVVTNLGPSPASSVTVTDAVPASVTFVSASNGGYLSGSNVVWTNLSIAASNSITLTLTVTAPPNPVNLTNSASVSGPALDPNSTNNVTPLVFTSVTPVADVALFKTAPPVVPSGLNFNYTLLVTNRGPSAAASVTVTDALPANVTFVSASNGGLFSGGNVLWTNLGNLAAQTSIALTVAVTAPASGSVTNSASTGSPTADPNLTNNFSALVISQVGNVIPTTVNDFAATVRNTPVSVNVLANDSDDNGDPLTLIGVTQTNGTASVSSPNVNFTPATNFLGNVVLTYTVIDGQGGTNTGLLTISVTNRPPVALDDAASATNGIPQVLFPLVNDSDPDGDPLTITNAIASNGTVSINAGSTNLTFTPTNSFGGTITYTVSDGFGGSATATIIITGNNAAPTAFNQGVTLLEDTSTNLVYGATDDGTNLTFAILISPSNGVISAFDPNAGTGTYTPNTNYFGVDSFSFTVFDGQLYATGLVNLIITPVNDAPVATNLNVSIPEDTATNLVLTASDVDSTNLVFAILTGPTNGALGVLNTNTGSVTYTPGTNFFGNDGFTFTVFDGSLYATGQVQIGVTPVNDAPILTLAIPNQSGVYGSPFSYTFPTNTFTDVDSGQTLTFTVSNLPPGITFDAPTRTFSGTPTLVGIYPVTVVATDNGVPNLSASDTFDINVAPVSLTIAANNQVRAYNQSNPPLTYLISGFVLGDTTNVLNGAPVLSTTATVSSPVGSYPISVSAGTLAATNYTFTGINGTLTITGATATVTWNPVGPITYGTPLGTNQNNATASVPGIFTYNPTNGTVLPAGTNTLSVIFTPTDTNYTAVNLTNALVVLPASLTITADDKVRVYGATNPPLTFSYSGFVNGETTNVVGGAPVLSTTATTNSPVGVYPITVGLGTLAASNYTITPVNATLTVTSATSVVTWNPVGPITYGTPLGTNQNNASASVPGTFTYSPTNGTVLPAGTNTLSLVFTPTDTNYTTINTNVQLVVLPASLSVTADNKVRAYGTTNPPLTFSYSGFVNGETTNVVSGSPVLGTTAITNSPVGSYPITVGLGSLTTSNYTITPVNGTLTITSATATVTWNPVGPITYGTPLSTNQNNATASVPGTFTYSPTNGAFLPVGTNVLSLVFTPTNTNYTGVNLIRQLVIVPATLTVAADNQARTFGQPNPPLTYTISGFVAGDTTNVVSGAPVLSTTATTNSPIGIYPITVSLGSLAASNYTFTAANGVLTVQPVFSWHQGANVFNPQTGLYEQLVGVTNITSATVPSFQVLVGDFASTNGTPRTNVWLWNATGTNQSYVPPRSYVQYNSPLDPGSNATVRLEFYNPTRVPFTNSIEILAALPTPAVTNLSGGVQVTTAFVDNRESGNPRFVIEWTSIPGRNYTIIYGPTMTGPWTAATPSVNASATRTQWYDDGPPKTASKPLGFNPRFYRVILNP